jgi:hypothetical protein
MLKVALFSAALLGAINIGIAILLIPYIGWWWPLLICCGSIVLIYITKSIVMSVD